MRAILTILLGAGLVLATPDGRPDDRNLPNLSDSAARVMSQEQERVLGQQIIRQIRAEGWILDDPELTEYVTDLGQRLLSHSTGAERTFNFFVVNNADVNAFALPGGNIGMFAGMIMASDNESELAGVMAHEVAHVTQRHIARGMEAAAKLDMATMVGIMAGIMIGMRSGEPRVTEAAIMTGSSVMMQGRINFTRTHEHEADRVGIGILADAGYDPEGMATMFEQMERRARLSGRNTPEFLSTHPVSTARVSEARNRAKAVDVGTLRESRNYALMKARARALTTPNDEALDYFRKSMDGATGAERTALTYGEALVLIDMARASEARELLAPLIEADEDVKHYHLAMAETYVAEGDLDAALARYERAMRLFPGNYAVTTAYARVLLDAGRGEEAFTHLVSLLPQPHADPQLYRLLASSSDSAGRKADAHYFLSQVYAMNGELMPAVQQLRIALAVPDISEQQRLRMEARLEQLVQHVPREQRVRRDAPGQYGY